MILFIANFCVYLRAAVVRRFQSTAFSEQNLRIEDCSSRASVPDLFAFDTWLNDDALSEHFPHGTERAD